MLPPPEILPPPAEVLLLPPPEVAIKNLKGFEFGMDLEVTNTAQRKYFLGQAWTGSDGVQIWIFVNFARLGSRSNFFTHSPDDSAWFFD